MGEGGCPSLRSDVPGIVLTANYYSSVKMVLTSPSFAAPHSTEPKAVLQTRAYTVRTFDLALHRPHCFCGWELLSWHRSLIL